MQSFRGSLAHVPYAVSNLIGGSMSASSSNDTPESGSIASNSVSGDDSSEKSHAIPSSLIKEQWQLVLDQDASVSDLSNAIDRCKELVLNTDQCSDERKWLVRHLVELRFRLREIEDTLNDSSRRDSIFKVILGHHFSVNHKKNVTSAKLHCDHCTGVIWSVVQASYVCNDCGFVVHHKCVENVLRVCAHVIASERKEPIDEICPETGLSFQEYKCAECQASLSFKNGWVEPRICDYTGLYYCPSCHWNDQLPIPARILHNWDFTPSRVCRATFQELTLLNDRPVIDLEARNAKLFIYVQNLSLAKKLRTNLNYMRCYLTECRVASTSKLLETSIGKRRHLIQCVNMYSIADLIAAENGTLGDFLNKLFTLFEQHIRKCELCTGRGYLCEVCANVEVLYPFDDCAFQCKNCSTVLHRACWLRKNQKCPKCIRIEKRRSLQQQCDEDQANANEPSETEQ